MYPESIFIVCLVDWKFNCKDFNWKISLELTNFSFIVPWKNDPEAAHAEKFSTHCEGSPDTFLYST
jgi:hypothetical protein